MYRPVRSVGRILRGMTQRTPTLTPMPPDFYWAPRWQYDEQSTGLFLDGVQVASLHEKVGGGWIAYLSPYAAMFSPQLKRDCTSFDAGRRGAELWALRHEAVLRAKVAEVEERFRRSRHPAMTRDG